MNILIAPDKFKGSLSAHDVCLAIEKGVRQYDENIKTTLLPLADGGEGSLAVVSDYISSEKKTVLVKDPLGRSIQASYLLSGPSAYIELAAASGYELLSQNERNPLYTSTYGTGEIILDALSHGAMSIYLFIGGSATNDMGIGMAQALGYRFLDKDKDEVPPVGISLPFITNIEKDLKYDHQLVKFYAVCDVDNPLYGKRGAAYVYAKQKGAGKYAIEILDKGLRKLSKRCRKFLDRDVAKIPGSGAAGGVGGGVLAFLNGDLLSGSDFFLDLIKFDEYLNSADLVITGEGQIDDQTLEGKAIAGVVNRAGKNNIPIWAVVGNNKLSNETAQKFGIIKTASIMDVAKNINDAHHNASKYITQISHDLFKSIK